MSRTTDVAIIGAGILGMATAMMLVQKHPRLRVAVLEKETRPAGHQTGHNSGVIHSGIYYRPGSYKAHMCVTGARALMEFCEAQGVAFERCGKVVIATRHEEIPALHELYRRGTANGAPGLRLCSPAEIRAIEPHTSCLEGMHVPSTGIVDFKEVTRAYARVFEAAGGSLYLGWQVTGIRAGATELRIDTTREEVSARVLINCAGLYADRICRMSGCDPGCQIVPFRGEYYEIRPERRSLVRHLIYPVPDPRFPFLGVHFTRMIDGKVEAGPNAVLAWAREGYYKRDVNPEELLEVLRYRGFWHMAGRYWRSGFQEMARSYSKARFTRALQRLIPAITEADLSPGGAGVRAQALGAGGALLDDFAIVRANRMVHVLNAPSPAATSSLAIAGHILHEAAPFLPA